MGRSLGDYSDTWWDEAIDRLVRHADKKLQKRKWLGINGGDPPSGIQAKDIIQGVLDKVLRGRRNWDPDANPDLL